MDAVHPDSIAIIKSTAPVLAVHGNTITTLFYNTMIAENSSLNNIFSTTSQTTGRQPRALAGAVLAYATYIDDLPKLTHAIERIAHKHASLQVTPAQYDIVGKYLMQAIGQVLGAAATAEIVDAWTAAYGFLASVFIGREADLYKSQAADGWLGWRKFRIAKKVPESGNITSFYLTPSDGVVPLPKFLPGQYVSLQLPVPSLGYLQSRQYSLSAAPREKGETYRISVKREEGQQPLGIKGIISNMLHDEFSEGGEVELSHPQGEFVLDPADKGKEGVPVVLISAGVGATALMSILDSLTPSQEAAVPVKRPVSWIHASWSSELEPFGEAVRKIAGENENVSANVFLETLREGDKLGVQYQFAESKLDLAKLDQEKDLHVGDSRSEYYLCGSEGFMVEMRRALVALGVDKERVYLELFATGDVGDE
ncbi:globin-like protein [Cercophora scortea]|uniref:nitric oxide dioxygenase n=1 Tax=Cercophora scortea TaxID=314031 RepID=A0AAE0I2I6_9PEZI|nr:globin-like protein [Cercophora scortea]